MRRSFPVQVPSEGGADIDADLIQGGQIRVRMDFKNEGVATDFNGFVRVEVFNANNELVGASIYGQAEPNIFTRVSGGGGYFDYDEAKDWMLASVDGYTPAAYPSRRRGQVSMKATTLIRPRATRNEPITRRCSTAYPRIRGRLCEHESI